MGERDGRSKKKKKGKKGRYVIPLCHGCVLRALLGFAW